MSANYILQKPSSLKVKAMPETMKGKIIKASIALITVSVCTVLFAFHFNTQKKEILHYNVSIGNIWSKDAIKAEFTFPVFKDEYIYQREISEAKKEALPVFIFNDNAEKSSVDLLENLFKHIKHGEDVNTQILKDLLNETAVKDFLKNKSDENQKELKALEKLLRNFIYVIYRTGLSDKDLSSVPNAEIALRLDMNLDKILQKDPINDPKNFVVKSREMVENKISDKAIPFAREILQRLNRPNIIYSAELTEKARKLASESIGRTEGIVREGELIIDKGQRVTEPIFQKLSSYQHSKFLKNDTDNSFINLLGSFGHAGFIYMILLIYLVILRKKILADNFSFGLLSGLLLVVAFVSWLSLQIPTKYPIEYLIIVPGISMLVAIVFDSRTAFYFTVTISLMVSGIRGNDYDTGTTLMFAGILGAYTVRDIQSRTQIFKSIFFIAIGFAITILAFGFERAITMEQTIVKLLVAIINSVFAPLITFGLLFIIEKISNVTTDLKLEEYDNLNNPLILKLSETAPGTYQHTLQMAMLAERCAAAIDANRLYARVGALYHDIGKMTKPEYFVENQIEHDSKHDLISSKKSAAAIKSHVLDGMKLAEEYNLPQKIADFIPMHHGTFLIKHFYAKALEEANGEHVNEQDYRYPGPKPNTREAAIVMICDSAEAISRVIPNDKEELEKAIDKTINLRLEDGQFDECSITIRDLHIIKDTCVKSLFGIAHQRMEYKEIPGEQDKK